MKVNITLENSGQDFQSFICDKNGKIVGVQPIPALPSIWIGSYIPIYDSTLLQEGLQCPIRKAYSSNYGYLKHRIKKIETL